MITGSGSKSGNYMLEHKGFRKLAFTGSTEVGLDVARAAADKLIPSTLELGGKSANIYFRTASGIWPWTGFSSVFCSIRDRYAALAPEYFVHEDIYDRFIEDAVAAFNKVKVGMPWGERYPDGRSDQ